MKKSIALVLSLLPFTVIAQENISYQTPPEAIMKLADFQLAPQVRIDENRNFMLLLSRPTYKSIDELSREELRLAGLRIDPRTNIGSRTNYNDGITIKDLRNSDGKTVEVPGLPTNARLSNFTWSKDQKKIAFTNTGTDGVGLWVLDLETAALQNIVKSGINANLGDVFCWFKDDKALLVKMIPNDRKTLIDPTTKVPEGPTVSVNEGKMAQNRTYQDLLKNKTDEFNFEQVARSELFKIPLDGSPELWKPAAMYDEMSFSPDGEYVMISSIEKPFSYLVPYGRFPSKTIIYKNDGSFVETVVEVPLIEDLPKGFMASRKGRRNFSWRSDKPASLCFVEVLDDGDPEKEAEFRDEVFQLDAPFSAEPQSLLKLHNRYYQIYWYDSKNAIAVDYWWNTRNSKRYLFNPSDNLQKPEIIDDRNYQDRYNDPGRFVTKLNKYGNEVLSGNNNHVYLIGDGYTEKGQFPFLDKFALNGGAKERVYTSSLEGKLERLLDYNPINNELLVRIESPSEYPNYFFRNLEEKELRQLSTFINPFESIQGVHKEVLNYEREDGVKLSANLYLPVGYDIEKKEKMPMILWAYPTEFKDKNTAGQNTQNPNEFTFPHYGSPLMWLSRGYVILDDAAFPIVGEDEEEPNDTFRPQLIANAKAAIDAVDALGYIDRKKVAVGGHSYGAFMVANLLSHCDLFAAGIARSGAYNRTLTPFGFQSEERNYWEAPEVYYSMSPFMHADKMKTPLLLIHGEADNNSGTYPMQSERYFNALKGLGATCRLVILPKESHGYRAKESVMHLLWEQDTWLEKYVKNRNGVN